MLEPRATAATLADTTLLAYGSNYSSETGLLEGMGLSAYTIEGEKRFHHFEAEPIWLVETAGSHLTSALRTRARVRLWSSAPGFTSGTLRPGRSATGPRSWCGSVSSRTEGPSQRCFSLLRSESPRAWAVGWAAETPQMLRERRDT
jgi:hypothetical protein